MTPGRAWPRARVAAIACGAAALSALSGCAGDDRLQGITREIAALGGEVRAVKTAQETNAREWARVAAELRALEERSAAGAAEAEAAAARVARLESTIGALDDRLSAIQASLDELVRRQAMPAPAPASPAPAPPASPATTPLREPTAERIFNGALSSLRAGEHGQAVLELTDFLGRFPRHALAPLAQYWVAEAYFLQRDYRQALLEYQKVLEGYPRSQPVPEALLKIGLAHRALHDQPSARAAWERLVREHPASEAAVQARTLLTVRGSSRGAR